MAIGIHTGHPDRAQRDTLLAYPREGPIRDQFGNTAAPPPLKDLHRAGGRGQAWPSWRGLPGGPFLRGKARAGRLRALPPALSAESPRPFKSSTPASFPSFSALLTHSRCPGLASPRWEV